MTAIWFSAALTPEGWRRGVRVRLAGATIGAVECDVAARPDDERYGCAVPGIANAHSHAFQRGMAGLSEYRTGEGDSFWTWRDIMYRFVERLSPDQLRVIASQAYMEMLESGFTRVGEFHYLHHDPDGRGYADPARMAGAIAEAAAQTGIGLTLLPVFYAQGGFGGIAPGAAQRRFVTDIDGFARLVEAAGAMLRPLDGARLGVAPHSLRAVPPAALRDLAALVPDGPVHIHVAEQLREVEDCRAATGRSPVALLYDEAAPDARWCLVHATHVDDDEIARIAASGAVVALCPITEANLGDGIFPATRFAAAGGRFAIGSDSNVRISAAGELALLEYGQRLHHRRRNLFATRHASTGRALFDAACAGGAQALGAPPAAIAPGAPADLVAFDDGHPALAGRDGDAVLDSWIFAAPDGLVDTVWRAGRKCVAAGRHVERDAIAARYAACLAGLLAG